MAVGPGAVETVAMSGVNFWSDKRVLVTGHTGFKGAWLSLWLLEKGARVSGLALAPETSPALFEQLDLASEIDHHIGDIRDRERVAKLIKEVQPDIVFHLAAQALVLRSYREPAATWDTNVMGTVHVLEALRRLDKQVAAVIVTTDKVYENHEWEDAYRERDPLGGHDPYSASKAAAELAVSSWRRSFLQRDRSVCIASVRAGNVIGGGDWAEHRIIPDLVRALTKGEPLKVRHPEAIRPWQHVLEPLDGYMVLAQRLFESGDLIYQDAFNFGPAPDAERRVRDVVEEALRYWPGRWQDASNPDAPHEAGRLALAIDRARARLGWAPRWDFARTVRETMIWYREGAGAERSKLRALSLRSLRNYEMSREQEEASDDKTIGSTNDRDETLQDPLAGGI